MNTLHGILTELGIENPALHPEREVAHKPQWVLDEKFIPISGKCYDITYGKVFFHGEYKHVVKRIRVDGPTPDCWIDLGEGKPLDPALHAAEVKGFRMLAP